MFHLRKREDDPTAIVVAKGDKVEYRTKRLSGKWWRVYPTDGKEVMALQMIQHQSDKFAPAFGGGALVKEAALLQFKLSPTLE
jgi:hypothetical protein